MGTNDFEAFVHRLVDLNHDLRTPLNSIIGFARIMLKGIDGPLTDNQREDLNTIYHSGQFLLGMLSDLVDMAKLLAGRLELSTRPVEVKEIVEDAIRNAQKALPGREVRVNVEVMEGLPPVLADVGRAAQVVESAISFSVLSNPQCTVSVKARPDHTPKPGDAPSFILISVSTDGPGLSIEQMRQLFEPFPSEKPPVPPPDGTGLRLPVARELARLHGGDMWAATETGHGAIFHIIIPIARPNGGPERVNTT